MLANLALEGREQAVAAVGRRGDKIHFVRFSVQIQRRGKSGVLKLYRLASTRIERHINVQGQAQPYDPQYTQYFEQRRCFAWRVR